MGDNLDLDSCLAELGIEEAADDVSEPSVQISTALSGRLLHIAQPLLSGVTVFSGTPQDRMRQITAASPVQKTATRRSVKANNVMANLMGAVRSDLAVSFRAWAELVLAGLRSQEWEGGGIS